MKINENAVLKLEKRKNYLEMGKEYLTGYPSIDMPWLKYYTEEEIMCPIPDMSAYDYLRILNLNNLNKPAITCLETSITYKELFENIENTAKMLRRLGVQKGEIVTMILPASFEEVYLFYALDKIGAVSNYAIAGTPLNKICENMNELKSSKLIVFSLNEEDEKYIFENTKTTDIVTTSPFDNEHKTMARKMSELLEESKFDIPVFEEKNDEDTLFMAKTGGTTGVPKYVMISGRSFNKVVHQFLNSSLNYSVEEKWLRLWPIFHVTSAVSGSHLPLCAGMEMILEPVVDLDKIDELIWKHKPNHLLMVPPLLEAIINSPLLKDKDLSFVKSIGCGGTGMTEALETKVLQFFKEHNMDVYLGCGYGLTENSSSAAVRMNSETAKKGIVGVPLVNTIISAFDVETGEEVKYSEKGEICIRSDNFMNGYFNDQELTNRVIKRHQDGHLWLHTGDIGFVTQDGFVYISGRMTRTIFLYTGEKVYPNSLEEKLSAIKGVKDISVISVPDSIHEGFMVPACCVVCEERETEEKIKADILNFCNEHIEKYAIPREIFVLSQLPVTKMGKVDYRALEQQAANQNNE